MPAKVDPSNVLRLIRPALLELDMALSITRQEFLASFIAPDERGAPDDGFSSASQRITNRVRNLLLWQSFSHALDQERSFVLSDSNHRSEKLHGDRPAAFSRKGYLDSKELAASAFERTRMPLVVTDAQQADFPIVLANQAFLKLTGYTAEEVVGRNCRFLQGKGTSPAVIAEIRAAVAEQREADIEVLNYRKDGSAFWNQLHLSPIFDDDGQLLYYFGSQLDVTEYRKVQFLEASEHRLLKEVDHRAKNVLAVVDGIVRLSRSDDAAVYAASIQQRVQALSHAHALLAERGWQEVKLGDIIMRQVVSFASDRISMEGPEILVPALIVQPLALVVHELLINAAVHGSLSGPSGRVGIHWQTADGQDGFKLRWQETGGRVPPPDARPGFGTALVGAMIEKQLLGQVVREWSDDGLVVDIVVPIGS